MIWKLVLYIAAALVCLIVLVLALFSVFSRRPSNLGLTDGRLAPCPDTPNCVCSQSTDQQHGIEPLRYKTTADQALADLKAVLSSFPRTKIVTATGSYLHAEFTSALFRYVDDVEFVVDEPAKTIHFRSASRAGRSDFGVNRQRMESIRKAFEEKAR
jgi:uncharacterized protein (DUF1499 family)